MQSNNPQPPRQKLISIQPAPDRPPQKIGVVDLANRIEQCVQQGKIDVALFYVEQATKRASQDPLVWQLAVRVYDAAKHSEKALHYCQKVLSKHPGHLPIVLTQLRALRALDRYDEALEVAQRVLPQLEDNADFQNTIGSVYKDLGKKDEALSHFNRSIEIEPTTGSSYWNRAELIEGDLPDSELARMVRMCDRESLSTSDKIPLRFAIAAAYRTRSAIDEEMAHLHEGNRLAHSDTPYVLEHDLSITKQVIEITSKEFLAEHEESDIQRSVRPIFIVGMPRSGSTLVEQILFSHSQVETIGESIAFSQALRERLRPPNQNLESIFDNVASIDYVRLGDEYLRRVSQKLGNCKAFLDKQLLNHVSVGFIRLAFPEARIIHAKRNPIATCLSCYQHLFPSRAIGFVYDLHDLAEKYLSYQELMAHWNGLFGDSIYTLEYERLIENQDAVTRDLLEYCGLPWEDACLDHTRAKRGIRTASKFQVRKLVYRDAVDRWRGYEKHLQPVIDRLGDAASSGDGPE